MGQNLKVWKISFLLLFGLIVFLYVFANTVAYVYNVITKPAAGIFFVQDKVSQRVVIKKLEPSAPAARSGMKAGDVILKFNDIPISNTEDLGKAYAGIKVGQPVKYTIARDGEERDFFLTTARRIDIYAHNITLSLLPAVVFCYALFIIGIFVFLKKIEDRTATVFYFMVISWVLAMWGTFSAEFDSMILIFPDLVRWIRLPSWPLAVGTLLHFTAIFPKEKASFQKHPKLWLVFIYSPLLLIIPAAYSYYHKLEWGDRLLDYGWGAWLSINFIVALNMLGDSIKHAPNAHVKKQAQIMMRGTLWALCPPIIFSLLPRLFFGKPLPYSQFAILLVILWPATLAYIIVKHRFMNIDVIVKRGMAYALTSGFVVVAYFVLVAGLGQLILILTGSTSQIVAILATLLIAALFNPVRERVRQFVDRRFYPNRFLYREAVHSFSHQLVKVVDLEKLLDLLFACFSETMRIRPVALLWHQEKEQAYAIRKTSGVEPSAGLRFTSQDKLIRRLMSTQQIVDLSALQEQQDFLSADEKARWEVLETELAMPLRAKGRVCGFFSLGMKDDDEPYYKEDLDLLAMLCDQVNISLENAILTEELREQDRLKKELEVARRIQLSTLPQNDPEVAGLDVSGVSIPAFEVGGDYYDYLDFTDGRFGVVIGDVSGKGTSAALYMSQLKGILKTASRYHRSIKDLLIEVNSITYKNIEAQAYITLMCAAFDIETRQLSLAKAGHLPLIHYSAGDRRCRQLIPKGIGIGLEQGEIFKAELEETRLGFGAGDVFVFYTDGVIEARNPDGEEFETEPLLNLIQQNGWASAAELRDRIISQVREFAGEASQRDDMTLVVVKADG
jgi:sigma-B regulation protein RsbU (phosphoserine phosphatase)